MEIYFVLPSYNEEKLLEKNTQRLFSYLKKKDYNFPWKIILLINGSNDSSEKIAKNLSKKNIEIDFFIIQEKGKGNAIKKYFDQVKTDLLFYMDIDLAVSLDNIDDAIKELFKENIDLVLGSRLKKGSRTDRGFFRELTSRSYILLSKIILNHSFSDLQCGFKGIKKEAWMKVSPFIEDKKWFFDTELLVFSQKLGLKTREVAINWSENRYEKRKSKIRIFQDSRIFIKKIIKLKKRLNKLSKQNISNMSQTS